jgi:hypothetical protein
MPALSAQLSALITELEGAPNNVVKLLTALLTPINDLEQVMMAVLTQRNIDTAVGAQLDIVGKVVGQSRQGLDDDTYRRYCRARVVANRSSGVTEDLIKVADLIVYDDDATYIVKNEGTATVRLRVDGIAITDDLATVLYKFERASASGGVRIVVQWGRSVPSALFRFDSGPGFDVGRLAGGIG